MDVVGVVVLAVAAIGARSVALAGFGLDSLIEIVRRRLCCGNSPTSPRSADTGNASDRVRIVGLAVYLAVQSTVVLALGFHPAQPVGIAWTGITAGVMFALAAGKARTGAALGNQCSAQRAGSP